MIRLIVTPEADPQKAGRFSAMLESTGDVVVTSTRQPLADGARELLARGFDPAELLTMRPSHLAYDSFRPAPVGEWAKLTFTEGETTPLRRQTWRLREMPIAAVTEGQKSGSEPSTGVQGHPDAKTLGAPTAAPPRPHPDAEVTP